MVPTYRYRLARKADLCAIARVFLASFPESITHYFHGVPSKRLERAVAEPFALCLASEPEAFLVADGGGSGVVGYIFAPVRTNRLPRVFFARGFGFRWFWRWLTGQYGFGAGPVWALTRSKLDFLSGSLRKGGPGTRRESGEGAAARDEAAEVQARILSVAVHPDHQGKGIAGRLCELALLRLDSLKVNQVRLEVRPDNEPAVRLYTRLGFREAGRYQDSQGDWLIMLRG